MPYSSRARYVDVLHLPGAPRTFGSALIGRAAYALVFLPLLYVVTEATGSIALAGTAIALYGTGASFLAPLRAWLIDRFGARRVLAILVVLFAATLSAISAAALGEPAAAVILVLSALAGVTAPQLGPTMRVAWSALVPEGELRRKAMSLDAVVEELLYLAGPAVAGLALSFARPGIVLLVPAFLVLTGGLLFIATPAVGAMRRHPKRMAEQSRRRPLIIERRFIVVVLPVLIAGGLSGAVSVAVPDILSEAGPSAAGVALGFLAGGSAVGGLVFGRLNVPGAAARQLLVLTLSMTLTLSALTVVSGAIGVSIVLAIAGLFLSPIMIVGYLRASALGGEDRQNSATTWVNTGHNLGSAASSALIGIGLQFAGVPTSITAMVVAALVLLGVVSALCVERARLDR